MGTVETCEMCLKPVGLEKSKNKCGEQSMNQLWSYLYHQNVQECLLPPINSPNVTPKLVFTFSLTGGAVGDLEGSPDSVKMCAQCGTQFEKLHQLHTELEGIKKKIQDHVKSINKNIPGSVIKQSKWAKKVEVTMTGSTTGQESISQTLKFLDQLCTGGSSSIASAASSSPSQSISDSNLIKIETCHEGVPPKSTEDANFSSPPPLPPTEATDPLAADPSDPSDRLLMEVDPQQVEYHVGQLKSDPDHLHDPYLLLVPSHPEPAFLPESDPLSLDSYPSTSTQDPLAEDTYITSSSSSSEASTSRKRKRRKKKPVSASFSQKSTPGKTVDLDKRTCPICPKTFKNGTMYSAHMKIHAVNDHRPPLQCPFCPEKFLQKRDLQIHQRQHSGEPAYKCDLCHNAYTSRADLISHFVSSHKTH